jgi:hypothetical protein
LAQKHIGGLPKRWCGRLLVNHDAGVLSHEDNTPAGAIVPSLKGLGHMSYVVKAALRT